MSSIEELKHMQIPLEEISSATNRFAIENLIALGGFGEVYHGKSETHGIIAVKRLVRNNGVHSQGEREFLTEIALLSVYKHENIVSLLGFCDENGEKILVYKHESRGNLQNYIDSKDLTWIQRLQICLDAARGLKYLHDDVGPQHRILHRDVKSSNILLDDNWKAKISDFGLSKIGPSNVEYTFLISDACGTIGYIDPEYMNDGILTQKSDVYSFGVVLFEVLCGRPARVVKPGEKHQLLVKMVKSHWKDGTLEKIIVSDLQDSLVSASFNKFTSIACQCLNEERGKRPLMSVVVNELEEALAYQLASIRSRADDNLTYSHMAIEQSSSRRRPLESMLNGYNHSDNEKLIDHNEEEQNVSPFSIKNEHPNHLSIYNTDEFRMYSFKIRPCARAYSHDWAECQFVHPGEKARRRDPRKYHYSCVPCPDFRKGSCRRGDLCEYAHGVFECWLHPRKYRTRLCKDKIGCNRRVCFFAHSLEELRPLYP